MAEFKRDYVWKKIQPKEGVYANDPDDTGGETVVGIARKKHPDWNGWPYVDQVKADNPGAAIEVLNKALLDCYALTVAIELFYRAEFWDPIRGDEMTDQLVADEIFDTAINCGIPAAVKCAQRASNYLNLNGSLFADMVVDGRIGSITLAALNVLSKDAQRRAALLIALNGEQYRRYAEIVEHNPKQEKFFSQWLRGRVGLGD